MHTTLIMQLSQTLAANGCHSAIYLASTLTGAAAHKVVFGVDYEWDLEAPQICLFYICSLILIAMLALAIGHDYYGAMVDAVVIGLLHALGLFFSIFVYRTSLLGQHRLASFPGPWLAKITHAYMIILTIRHWHLFEELQALHETYGDYVRIGPNTLSVSDPHGIKAIHGAQSKCTKGPMYDIAHPRHTLHFLRDRWQHAERRRDWRRALDGQALSAYEPKIAQCISQLLELLTVNVGQPINAAKVFNLFSFDTMGVLGFGCSFGRMRDGEMDYYMRSLHMNTLMVGTFLQTPWIMQILKRIPFFNMQYTSFIAHSRRLAEIRIKCAVNEPTIFGPIVEAYKQKDDKTEQARQDLYGDADLIVIAGSDTIAAVLCSVSFCLAQHSEHVEIVRRLARGSRLQAVQYMDAVIYEALRLHPVIASGLQRVTPREGLYIGSGVYIPGNVRVHTPSYVMSRDERFFAHPDKFMPERFLSRRTELVHNISAYIPFNTGIYSCIGKQLAMKELNMALLELVTHFDFRTVPGYTETDFLRAKRDTFTLSLKDLPLVFSPVSDSYA